MGLGEPRTDDWKLPLYYAADRDTGARNLGPSRCGFTLQWEIRRLGDDTDDTSFDLSQARSMM